MRTTIWTRAFINVYRDGKGKKWIVSAPSRVGNGGLPRFQPLLPPRPPAPLDKVFDCIKLSVLWAASCCCSLSTWADQSRRFPLALIFDDDASPNSLASSVKIDIIISRFSHLMIKSFWRKSILFKTEGNLPPVPASLCVPPRYEFAPPPRRPRLPLPVW
jgi:hypothetical protein